MSITPGSTAWFARHELNLAWRDWLGLITGGRRGRGVVAVLAVAVFALLVHMMVNIVVAPWVRSGIVLNKDTLVAITGCGVLFWTVMLSQAMESVTRAYYARADLDLIISSPAQLPRVFAVRTGAIALSTVGLSCLLASPLINTLVYNGGPKWLAAYGVLIAFGALSAALSLLLVIALFRIAGPKRTRLISQILAAVIGAGFAIGVQAAAILSFGNMSRLAILQSVELTTIMPGLSSPLYLPARAAMGDMGALSLCLGLGLGALLGVITITSASYGRHVLATSTLAPASARGSTGATRFWPKSQRQALRMKEWLLLRRDPWLLSQTLMQVLYLLPPALMLWINYGERAGAYIVVVPVLIMAAGQLAGGLAWLALSGEDAPDLVATAPVSAGVVLAAKVEAVLAVIALVLAPLIVIMALSEPNMAGITAICALLAAGSATLIQILFKAQSKRAMFRRRQVASRLATISEALASIMWAGTGAVLAGDGGWIAIAPATIAVLVLGLAYMSRPRNSTSR